MASFVALQEAQEKLAELLDRAQSGEEIAIEQGGKAARPVPVATSTEAATAPSQKRARWGLRFGFG